MLIDTSLDFRTDAGGKHTDWHSTTLYCYHKLLWSKVLPGGALFNLEICRRHGTYALQHHSRVGEFFLTSDTIIHSYTSWSSLKHITELFPKEEGEAFKTMGSTIGARLIFPGNMIAGKRTINGARGCHSKIMDRFDLTLECIRRHYMDLRSPLEDTLKRYGDFFALFGDFRGYVEFFMLQDLVVHDFSAVTFFIPFDDFRTSPVPEDADTYKQYRRLTQTTPKAMHEAAIIDTAIAPAPRRRRAGMTEAQALAEAQAMYGPDALVWCSTHDAKGKPFETPRYRVGYKARTETGPYIENGLRMKGVGGSWAEAVRHAETSKPRSPND